MRRQAEGGSVDWVGMRFKDLLTRRIKKAIAASVWTLVSGVYLNERESERILISTNSTFLGGRENTGPHDWAWRFANLVRRATRDAEGFHVVFKTPVFLL